MTNIITLKTGKIKNIKALSSATVSGNNVLSLRQQKVHYDQTKTFSFSFSCFDRISELFNLSDKNKVVPATWFLELLDCLKEVNKLTILELKQHHKFQLHRIDWHETNAKCPIPEMFDEFWQFRINKSKGRIIGYYVQNVFYIVWLDYHHNLTNSEGYGKVVKYSYIKC